MLLILFIPNLIAGVKLEMQKEENALGIQGLLWYCMTTIALFFAATYFLGMDLTLAPRFYFILFPAVILLLGIALAGIWQGEVKNRLKLLNQTLVMFIWGIGLLGGIISVFNLGYLQSHRPDLFITILEKYSSNPVVIAAPFKHHGHTGRMTAIAWGLRNVSSWENTKFFLADVASEENYDQTIHSLKHDLATLEKPLDLWLVNFRSKEQMIPENCRREKLKEKSAGQYNYKLYLCQDWLFNN
jgi:uncharacterized membrane protein